VSNIFLVVIILEISFDATPVTASDQTTTKPIAICTDHHGSFSRHTSLCDIHRERPFVNSRRRDTGQRGLSLFITLSILHCQLKLLTGTNPQPSSQCISQISCHFVLAFAWFLAVSLQERQVSDHIFSLSFFSDPGQVLVFVFVAPQLLKILD
jgi:hypothetical protein